MSNNKYYLETIIEIENIQKNNFEISSLRLALEITNKINFLSSQNKLTKKESNNLNNLLKETIETKFIELNPNLTKNTLNKICKCYNREYICLPNDITIINNDVVFYNEYNYGNPYDNHTILLNDNSKNKFTELTKTQLSLCSTKNQSLLNEIITIINTTLKPFFKKQYPILSIKNNKIEQNNYIRTFITPNLNQILETTNNKKNITLNLIVLGDWNEFYYFKININLQKNKIQNWSWKLLKPSIWNLTEELDKKNNNKNILKRKK